MLNNIGGKEIALYIERLSKEPYASSVRKSMETKNLKSFSETCASAGIPKEATKRLLKALSSDPIPLAWFY